MKLVFIAFSALALMACKSSTFSAKINTPNGVMKETLASGPYSSDHDLMIDTTAAYEECLQQHSPTMGSDQAGFFCRGQTQGGPVPSSSVGGNFVAPMMIGPGMMAPTDPRAYASLPGGQPFMITPTAVAALEHHPGNVVPVMVPSGAVASATGSDDLTLIVREQAQQHKRLCDIEKKQGRPCKK